LEHDPEVSEPEQNRVAIPQISFNLRQTLSILTFPMQVRFKLATGIKLKLTASPESLHQTGGMRRAASGFCPSAGRHFGNQVQSIWIA